MYIPIEKLKEKIPKSNYNKGACDMLECVANLQGREDSESVCFAEFFREYLDAKLLLKITRF